MRLRTKSGPHELQSWVGEQQLEGSCVGAIPPQLEQLPQRAYALGAEMGHYDVRQLPMGTTPSKAGTGVASQRKFSDFGRWMIQPWLKRGDVIPPCGGVGW